MKTRLPLFAFLNMISLLLAACNLPVSPATPSDLPTQTITDTTPIPSISSPTLSGPAIPHVPAGDGISIMKIHMLDDQNGWGIGGLSQAQDHVFRTKDGGSTWQDVTPPQPTMANADKYVISGDFRDMLTAWIVFGTESVPPPPFLYFWITHDGGETWQYSTIDTSISSEHFIPWLFNVVNPTEGWLLVYLGSGMSHNYVVLLNTIDGGMTWTTLVTPQDDNDIQSCSKTGMVFIDVLNGWLARECNGLFPAPHFMRTTDGGLTWKSNEPLAPASAPNLFIDYVCDMASPIPFSTTDIIMLMKCRTLMEESIETDYFYSTDDGGLTWNTYPMPVGYSLGQGLYFFDRMNGFALGPRIYKTEDGGLTWTFVQEVTWSGQFSFINPDQGWASVMDDTGENALVVTTNGGLHWDILNPMVVP